ncbi:ATP synthase subunit I [Rhabdochromatium marinum]|uniref:ATP synthase subunit I n=1 Tax=Rhabdochromatium marinum TaxID=48729 RepID=UPI001904629E|nr:ATP synthase subunit I [Rhabdochromatium marinum]MBK1647585.1 F0F1 ATP synthase assembly protein I [Rhabdochromatium marinum]
MTGIQNRQDVQPHQIRHLLRWQGILSGIALLLTAPFGSAMLISAVVGSVGCWLANGAAAFWIFRHYRAQQPGALVLRFYGAEIVKITLVMTLFTIAYTTIDALVVPMVLGSYLIVQTVPALIPSSPKP